MGQQELYREMIVAIDRYMEEVHKHSDNIRKMMAEYLDFDSFGGDFESIARNTDESLRELSVLLEKLADERAKLINKI